jgi:two-component system, NarL family, sensor histidine kinase DesK
VIMLSLTYGLAFLWLFIGVSAIVGVLLPVRRAFVVVTVLIFLPLVISLWINGGVASVDWLQLIPLMLLIRALGLDMIGMTRLSEALRELHTTQEELARQALREVREAVTGYRQPRLANEVDSARQLLEAAGIGCSLQYTGLELPTVSDAVLAWTVREGVTNVIRHSHARHCIIRLNRDHHTVHAEVINDGGLRERASSAQGREGLGLSGLTERVTSLGGSIEAGPVRTPGRTGFHLCVELPIEAPALTAQEA